MPALQVPASARLSPVPACPTAEVWKAELDLPPADLRLLEGVISQSERTRADTFGQEALRNRFVARRSILRILLARRLGQDPRALSYRYGPSGKPELAGGGMHFSIAHTGGSAVFALSPRQPVGVDVERVSRDFEFAALLPDHFTAAERQLLSGTPEADRAVLFFALWVRKEACAKAIGEGLGVGLKRFEAASPPASPGAPLYAEDRRTGDTLTVYDLPAGMAWRTALALK